MPIECKQATVILAKNNKQRGIRMALTTCKECGHEISTTAAACPNCGATLKTKPPVGSGCFWILIIGIAAVVGLFMFGGLVQQDDRQSRSEAISSGQWRVDTNISISRALVQGGATGCGEYRYLAVDSDSEYIVECFDGIRKRYYRVWPKIGSIAGPYTSLPTD
jgi:hypothetical protein